MVWTMLVSVSAVARRAGRRRHANASGRLTSNTAGICDGLGLGHNSIAALITRGLAEITRLVVACGGREQTMSGLAGLGDLVLTCTGELSRNRSVGVNWDAVEGCRRFSPTCTAPSPRESLALTQRSDWRERKA